jgi:hypothetical protein
MGCLNFVCHQHLQLRASALLRPIQPEDEEEQKVLAAIWRSLYQLEHTGEVFLAHKSCELLPRKYQLRPWRRRRRRRPRAT